MTSGTCFLQLSPGAALALICTVARPVLRCSWLGQCSAATADWARPGQSALSHLSDGTHGIFTVKCSKDLSQLSSLFQTKRQLLPLVGVKLGPRSPVRLEPLRGWLL